MWFPIFLLIQVIGYPLVGRKLYQSIFKKDQSKIKKNAIWLMLLFVFSGLVFEIIPGSKLFWWPIEAIESKSYTKSLIGISFILPEATYNSDSDRAFNGDGRSLTIYKLKESVNQQLLNPNSSFFVNYPTKGIRDDWQIEKWTKTPIKSEHQDALYFASNVENFSNYDLNKILNESGNYYAFKYYMHSFLDNTKHFGNIDFYIISPKRKLLIIINVNT